MRGELVGKPGNAVSRVAEYRRCNTGLLDLAVTEAQRRDPPQIGFVRFERTPAGHQPGVAGIVGDAVDDRAGLAGLRIGPVQPRVEDLQ